MSKTLYLISFYFAPLGRADGVNRAYLSRYLADLGWRIEVICAENPRGLLRNYQTDRSLLEVLGPRVTRHAVPYDFRLGLPELAAIVSLVDDPFRHWARPALARAREVVDSGGIVYAVVPPATNARIAWRLATEKQLPLVLDFRDNTFGLPKELVRSASGIVASTQQSLDDMLHEYGPCQNVAVYYNGFPDDPRDGMEPAYLIERSALRVIYAGLLNWEQHPLRIARALRSLKRSDARAASRIYFDFYGPRNYYTRAAFALSRNASIRFHGYLPFEEMRSRLRSASMGYSSLASVTKTYCIPSKVFQYVAAGLPIFAVSPEGALAKFVRDNALGVHHYPRDTGTIAHSLARLASDEELLASYREQVRLKRNHFALRKQVDRLATLLDKVNN